MFKSLVLGSSETQKLKAQKKRGAGRKEGEWLKARGRTTGIRGRWQGIFRGAGGYDGRGIKFQLLRHGKKVDSVIRKKGGSVKVLCGERGVHVNI